MANVQKLTDPAVWRLKKDMGGGPLFDIGIYCLNTARFLLGTEPEWVSASMYSTPNDPRFKEVEEAVMFQLGFPGGVLVNASSSFAVQEARRYRCLAEDGWFGLENAFAYNGLQMESNIPNTPQLEDANHFALEMDHMAQCILQDKPPYTPGEEGLQDHRIMEAIFQSAKEQKRVMLQQVEGVDVFRNALL
jgi:predicted dehydrogenase